MSTGEPTRATLFGKLPSALDFIRINHTTEASLAFDEWLQGASQQLAQRNAAWPGVETSFVFVARTAALVGLLMPSRDR
ncbi:MAG TPA: type VI secretion system-associated protein TagF, partial [Polyangiales bacterium]|nr:type VI secretion system-associated protein TagF [Polyangiales bacterium]